MRVLILAGVLAVAVGSGCLAGDKDCGPIALNTICGRLGMATSVEELRGLAGASDQGTTLLGLAEAASAKGLSTLSMKTTLNELKSANVPAIAYLWKNTSWWPIAPSLIRRTFPDS